MNNNQIAKMHDAFLTIADREQFEEFICPECGEHTDTLDPCCGVVVSEYNQEPELNNDR